MLILVAAIIFTNGVESLGKRLGLSEGGVGSVLAAVGTALPETVVPIIAIVWIGGSEAVDVGIGAILGAPFMLVTLTLPLTAAWILILSALNRRQPVFAINKDLPIIDLGYFLSAFSLAILASLFSFPFLKYAVAFVLIAVYIRYLSVILRTGEVNHAAVPPLYFARKTADPSLGIILLQIVAALVLMVTGAHVFVDMVKDIAPALGISPLILSLLLTPVATELPEKFNSLVWVSQKKDTLAVGNITGAMVFQGTIPVSIGMVFTPWKLDHLILVCASIAIVSALIYYLILKKSGAWKPWQVLAGGFLYIGFGLYLWLQ